MAKYRPAFTLTELLVELAIIVILTLLMVGSFTTLVANQTMRVPSSKLIRMITVPDRAQTAHAKRHPDVC